MNCDDLTEDELEVLRDSLNTEIEELRRKYVLAGKALEKKRVGTAAKSRLAQLDAEREKLLKQI